MTTEDFKAKKDVRLVNHESAATWHLVWGAYTKEVDPKEAQQIIIDLRMKQAQARYGQPLNTTHWVK